MSHTMRKMKVTVTIEARLIEQVDSLVRARRFPSRSQMVEQAIAEKIEGVAKRRLEQECAKLDPTEERSLADEGYAEDLKAWPAY